MIKKVFGESIVISPLTCVENKYGLRSTQAWNYQLGHFLTLDIVSTIIKSEQKQKLFRGKEN